MVKILLVKFIGVNKGRHGYFGFPMEFGLVPWAPLVVMLAT